VTAENVTDGPPPCQDYMWNRNSFANWIAHGITAVVVYLLPPNADICNFTVAAFHTLSPRETFLSRSRNGIVRRDGRFATHAFCNLQVLS
jgi:hypothetical protein